MTNKTEGDHALLRDSLYGTSSEPTYASAVSFMRRKYTRDLEGVDLVVTGVPLDTATTNRPGDALLSQEEPGPAPSLGRQSR